MLKKKQFVLLKTCINYFCHNNQIQNKKQFNRGRIYSGSPSEVLVCHGGEGIVVGVSCGCGGKNVKLLAHISLDQTERDKDWKHV